MGTNQEIKWHKRFLDLCAAVSGWSKDRSTQTGCVIIKNRKIISTGYNGFTPGIDDDNDNYHQRPQKYLYTEHCDRNAIYAAAREGIKLAGSTMYLTGPPCADCSRGIVMSGIVKVIWPFDNTFEKPGEVFERWKDNNKASFEILEKGGVKIERIK